MNTLGNIVWFVFFGLWMGIIMAVLGALFCATIIFIPFGLQCFKVMKFSFMPFGKDVYLDINKHPILNILWAAFVGVYVCTGFVTFGIVCCITIIGIPLGVVAFRGAKLSFFPVSAQIEKF